MSRNGSGTYSLPAGNPVVSGTTISSTWANNTLSDIASALTYSIAKDGQTTPTANLPMGGYKLTGLAAGTSAADSARFDQLFNQGVPTDIASAATVDIGAQLTNFLKVTGTTGITSFGTNYKGPKILKFAGILTITYDSTTLLTPGAANITTAAGDTCIVVPKATTSGTADGWQIIAYQRSTGLPIGAASPGANADITSFLNDALTVQGSIVGNYFNVAGPAADNNWAGEYRAYSNDGTTVRNKIVNSINGMGISVDGGTNTQLRINTYGIGLTGATPSSGIGVSFPATQSASSDNNTLDDFEKGNWTPVLGGDGGTSGQTYNGQYGRYVKIGNMVTCWYYVDLSNKGTVSGNLIISGLPFAVNSGFTPVQGAGGLYANFATNWTWLFAGPVANQTYAFVGGQKVAQTTWTQGVVADIGNTSRIEGSFSYII